MGKLQKKEKENISSLPMCESTMMIKTSLRMMVFLNQYFSDKTNKKLDETKVLSGKQFWEEQTKIWASVKKDSGVRNNRAQ